MAYTGLRFVVLGLALANMFGSSRASVFLGRNADDVPSEQLSLDVQHALLGELEELLGGEHKSFTERRLAKIKDGLRPIFVAMPKNEHGNLDHAAASYALHRLFVKRHGWSVKGLQSEGKALASWNTSSPVGLFQADQASEHVAGPFEQRIAREGLGLHELAVLAGTLEHFVHREAVERLRVAYRAHGVAAEGALSADSAREVMDSYMAIYILGFMLKNVSAATPKEVTELRRIAPEVYPTWSGTQLFIREVQDSMAFKRDTLRFSEVAAVIEEAGERYGPWQECRTLKDELMVVEDEGPNGAGRVRLSDFYRLALHEGKSQFSESIQFLRQQGALDESDPSTPRVIITNYIASPSNCVASSSFFSVCCFDECEGLFQQLERRIAAPAAQPVAILRHVSALASHTMAKNRAISPWLQQRLQDIAAHHGGLVPLHGRLFTQWMHFAYPRECTYPHVSGAMQGQRPEEVFSLEALETLDSVATQEEMTRHIELAANRSDSAAGLGVMDSFDMWSMEEELVVSRPPQALGSDERAGSSSLIRGIAFVGLVAVTMFGLKRTTGSALTKECDFGASHKYYV